MYIHTCFMIAKGSSLNFVLMWMGIIIVSILLFFMSSVGQRVGEALDKKNEKIGCYIGAFVLIMLIILMVMAGK